MRFFVALMKCLFVVTHNQGMYCHLICALVQAIEIVKIDSLLHPQWLHLYALFKAHCMKYVMIFDKDS
jgi:hypothetical protein